MFQMGEMYLRSPVQPLFFSITSRFAWVSGGFLERKIPEKVLYMGVDYKVLYMR